MLVGMHVRVRVRVRVDEDNFGTQTAANFTVPYLTSPSFRFFPVSIREGSLLEPWV